MEFKRFLAAKDAPTLTELSALLGVSKGRLSQLSKGANWPPELALTAEEKTGGKLDAAKLSPTIRKARANV